MTHSAPQYDVMVDIDNVLFPFVRAFHKWLCTVLPGPIPYNYDSWTFYRAMGLTDEQFKDYLMSFARSGGFAMNLSPQCDVSPLVDLWSRGHRIHIVTNRPQTGNILADTKSWLDRWGIPFDTLTIHADKAVFLDYAKSETTFGVDDAPANIRRMEERGVRAYLFTQPHNLADRQDGEWHRIVDDLYQFRAAVLRGQSL